MSRDRVLGYLGLLTVADILVLVGALVSPLLAAWLLIACLAVAVLTYRGALRDTERALYRAKLELATVRPEEREEAQRRQASQQEVARVAGIVQKQGWHFPEDDRGPSLPDGYGFITWK